MSTELVCGWTLEEQARAKGALRIAGVDEVGRGPLFGPVVAAAVILPKGCNLPGLNDSKKLNERKRNELEPEIKAGAVAWAIAEVDAATIDRINIRQASLLAMRRAVAQLALSPDFLLIDGRDTIQWECPQQAVIKGDATSFSIAAASVLAKVYRDRMIVELDAVYPGYGLARHKGYGCPEHLNALARLGPTPLHRRSFHGVRQDVLLFDAPAPACEEEPEEAEIVEEEVDVERTQRYACPCCGYLTLAAEPPGTQAICEVCQWEDDQHQCEDPSFEGGANAPSLPQARENYKKIGVSDPSFSGNGRKPLPEEIPQQPKLFF